MDCTQFLNLYFPINDYTERATVDYVNFDIGIPKYDVEECSQRGMTYGAPLLVNFRLIIWDIDEIAGTKSVRDIKGARSLHGRHSFNDKKCYFCC